MYDVLVGSTLAEVRAFKQGNPAYRKWVEVSPRSVDRLRGIRVDGYAFLPGATRAAGEVERMKMYLNICTMAPPRGEVKLVSLPRRDR